VDVLKLTGRLVSPDHELNQALRYALAGLREEAAEILVLHDVEGYTRKEIAEKKQMTEAAVAMSLSRSRKRMRELMEHGE
jgi:RNA polymerase sigma factor (sigma-70 family)